MLTKLEPVQAFAPAQELDYRSLAQSLADLVDGALGAGDFMVSDGESILQADDVRARAASLAGMGVQAGDVVLILAAPSLRVITDMLAIWRLGAAVCPVETTCPEPAKAAILEASRAAYSIDLDGRVIRREGVARVLNLRTPRIPTGVDLALVVFTSGSSGTPKGVLLTHANVLAATRSIVNYLGLRSSDRILCLPPLHFDYGLYQILLAMFAGCSVLLPKSGFEPVSMLKLCRSFGATVLPLVPVLATALTRVLGAFGSKLETVRLITNTGGHLPVPAIAALRSAFPNAAVTPMYGLTESKRALYLRADLVDSRPGSVGRAMPGLDARVLITASDGGLHEAAPGEEGELHVRGASVMQGYHGADTDGGARLIAGAYRDDNWLATGDLFSVDADGFLYFRGRAKGLIKQAGYCVYPRDLESVAERLDNVTAAVAVGVRQPDGDESAILFIQPAPGVAAAAWPEIEAALRDALPRTIAPRIVRFIQAWPETSNGKIDRTALSRIVEQEQA